MSLWQMLAETKHGQQRQDQGMLVYIPDEGRANTQSVEKGSGQEREAIQQHQHSHGGHGSGRRGGMSCYIGGPDG